MPTSFEDIENNSDRAKIIDWSATIINSADIEDLAKSIPKNTNATEITFELSNLTDSQFSDLAKAILERPASFELINIRHNWLTDESIPLIVELIKNNKSARINIEGNTFSNTPDNIKQLQEALSASGSKVNLITDLDLKPSQVSSPNSHALFTQSGSQKSNLQAAGSADLDAHKGYTSPETAKIKEECKEHTPPRKKSV